MRLQTPRHERAADRSAGTAGSSYGLEEDREAARSRPSRYLSAMLVALGALGAWVGPRAASAASATVATGGLLHTCALTDRGAVQCWGYNGTGQLGDNTTTDRSTPLTVTGLSSGVVAVAAGYYHTCAVTSAGALLCWGSNTSGQLGDGTTTNRSAPVAVTGLASGVTAVSAGFLHTCALTAGGGVRCWGANNAGQLGDGTTTNRLAPVAVTGLASGVAAVSVNGSHSCALTSGGAVLCWGSNTSGQLGDGSTTNRALAVAVTGLSAGVTSVSAGGSHTCALTASGSAMCWGSNTNGRLGDGTTTSRSVPTMASGMSSGVGVVAAGGAHTCTLTTGGAMSCWGSNMYGQLGDGTTTDRWTAVAVTDLTSGMAAASSGGGHTCVITDGGTLQCWGWNAYGQVGDGTLTSRTTAMTVIGLAGGVVTVAGGTYHSCALTTAGGVQCWGGNSTGQLGNGTTVNQVMPVAVTGLASGVAAVTVGGLHTCALMTTGGVRCWGDNAQGQLGDGTTTDRSVPVAVAGLGSVVVVVVAAGDGHTCALTSSGGVRCWGWNDSGQLGDGTATNRLAPVAVSGLAGNVVAIAAGHRHTCAVTTAGAVQCWGYNLYGMLGDGTTTNRLTPVAVSGLTTGVVEVTGGWVHTCSLSRAGAVHCWGNNVHGQLGDGTSTNRLMPTTVTGLGSGATAVTAGSYHTCAVTGVGGVQCWGENPNGQVGDGTTANRYAPVAVSGLAAGAFEVSAGGAHTCALTSGGVVRCWGFNGYGQLGDGTTTSRLTPVVAGIHRPSQDVDGNGTSDIVWKHATGGEVWLWRMAGTTVSAQDRLGVVGDTAWAIRGRGDQTGDGKADLLWRHATTGMIYLWTMNGAAITAVSYVGTVDPSFDTVGVGDYNGDSMSDILWRHGPTGELWVWQMSGAAILTVTRVATIDPAYAVVASGDVNADGRADIVWRHATTGDVWIWLMNGTAPTSHVYVGTVADLGYQVAGLGDHTGDGKSDLVWWHATTGDVWLWTLNGTGITAVTHLATVTDTGYRIAGNGDYDGDGLADVLWHHATRGEMWVWLMDGAAIRSATWVATVGDVGYQVQAGR